jgi:hypothetical protein
MPHLLVRHKVADFAKWKPVFDAHQSTRSQAGIQEKLVLRGLDDPGIVVLLFTVADVAKAKAFVSSPDLRETMTKSGVLGQPEVLFLT